jgi:hypothetical protein
MKLTCDGAADKFRRHRLKGASTMTNVNSEFPCESTVGPPLLWRELWLKEDWWAIWLGLGIVLVAYLFFTGGSSIKWLAVTPSKWSPLAQLGAHRSPSRS